MDMNQIRRMGRIWIRYDEWRGYESDTTNGEDMNQIQQKGTIWLKNQRTLNNCWSRLRSTSWSSVARKDYYSIVKNYYTKRNHNKLNLVQENCTPKVSFKHSEAPEETKYLLFIGKLYLNLICKQRKLKLTTFFQELQVYTWLLQKIRSRYLNPNKNDLDSLNPNNANIYTASNMHRESER